MRYLHRPVGQSNDGRYCRGDDEIALGALHSPVAPQWNLRYTDYRTSMRLRPILALALLALACRADTTPDRPPAAPAMRGDTSELVVVSRPTVIGFFRPALDSANASEDGYIEGVAHIESAVVDAQACLGRDSADARMIIDSLVRVQRGTRIDTLRFSMADSMPYGVYLVAPDRAPQLVRAYGPSQVMIASLEATPAYFG